MRLYTVLREGKEELFVSLDGGRTGCFLKDAGICFEDMTALILNWNEQTEEAVKTVPLKAEAVPLDGLKLCAPIVRPRQDLLCLGLNYRDHVEEAEREQGDTRGAYAVYFAKRCNASLGDGDGIPLHADICDSLDYEAELGVIIGKDAYKVPADKAEDYIFGYTIVNDISARNLQFRHQQWHLGKSLDGHTSMGPCIVLPDEIGDAKKLAVRCYVNGELRQNNNTANMITPVAEAIEDLTQGMTLKAGSIISTGTPSGVVLGMEEPKPWLKEGDEVVLEIENIGTLRNPVVQ